MEQFSSVTVKTLMLVTLFLAAGFSRTTRSVEALDGGRCSLKPETGPCRAMFPMFYYDPSSKSCKQFTYGGCEGNDNKFKTVDECKAACGGFSNEDL